MDRRVAWITGASRGIGRGAAIALGRAGWVVYVTARSSSTGRTSHLPGTVEETAAEVTAAGGVGIAAVCDHRDDAAVAAVGELVGRGHGRLDLLVNNAWAGYERVNSGAWQEWIAPFWEQPAEHFDAMFAGGVRPHYMATKVCAPLLRHTAGSLVVTLSVTIRGGGQPGGVAYAMAKAADDALAAAAAHELARHGVTSLALHPDWVRTEGVMQFADQLDLRDSQSPEGVGRVIVALASDTDHASLSGRVCTVSELALRYQLDVAT